MPILKALSESLSESGHGRMYNSRRREPGWCWPQRPAAFQSLHVQAISRLHVSVRISSPLGLNNQLSPAASPIRSELQQFAHEGDDGVLRTPRHLRSADTRGSAKTALPPEATMWVPLTQEYTICVVAALAVVDEMPGRFGRCV